MTDSVKIERLSNYRIAATLKSADDRMVLSEWLPPQQGIVPRIRIGWRWINISWALPIDHWCTERSPKYGDIINIPHLPNR